MGETKQDKEHRKKCAKERIHFEEQPPGNIVSSLNRLDENLCLLLVEFRRLNEILSYMGEDDK